MKGIFIIALVIAITFFIIKFIEMRFIEKESKPMKYLIRDALLVYFSVLLGNFVFEQVTPISDVNRAVPVFTGNPEF
jgi:TctA family transporter